MKNNIIRFKDNDRIIVVDELDYNDKKYIYGFQVDDNDQIVEDNIYTLEVKVENDKLVVNEIENLEVASAVNCMFLARLKQSE